MFGQELRPQFGAESALDEVVPARILYRPFRILTVELKSINQLEKRGRISNTDFSRLQQAGFSEAEIAEIVANVAIKPSN